jgi:hypothetical protein
VLIEIFTDEGIGTMIGGASATVVETTGATAGRVRP